MVRFFVVPLSCLFVVCAVGTSLAAYPHWDLRYWEEAEFSVPNARQVLAGELRENIERLNALVPNTSSDDLRWLAEETERIAAIDGVGAQTAASMRLRNSTTMIRIGHKGILRASVRTLAELEESKSLKTAQWARVADLFLAGRLWESGRLLEEAGAWTLPSIEGMTTVSGGAGTYQMLETYLLVVGSGILTKIVIPGATELETSATE